MRFWIIFIGLLVVAVGIFLQPIHYYCDESAKLKSENIKLKAMVANLEEWQQAKMIDDTQQLDSKRKK